MRRIWIFVCLVLCTLFSGPDLRAENLRLSFMTSDGDSVVIRKALNGLTLPEGYQADAFTLQSIEQDADNARFIEQSRIILVDVMDDRLSGYLIDKGLLEGRKVFALRESRDDEGLKNKGFLFDEKVSAYYENMTIPNLHNMIRHVFSLPADDVVYLPSEGLYHPDSGSFFRNYQDYLDWYSKRGGYDSSKPWLGIMFFSASVIAGQEEAYRDLIQLFEQNGFNVLPAYGLDQTIIEDYFLDEKRKSRVDLVLSFSLKFYSALKSRLHENIRALDVPLFNAITINTQTIDEWKENPQGLPATDVIWNLATPELSGVIEPVPLIGKYEAIDEKSGAPVYHYRLMKETAGLIVPRLRNWIRLKTRNNSEKKIAILYYNHAQGKQNIGASYLNVFRSLDVIIRNLKQDGYSIPDDLELSESDIQAQILKSGRNIGSWAPGELDRLLESGQVTRVPITLYKEWFRELPETFRLKVIEQWGEPEQSDFMIRDGHIIIPTVQAGNLVMLPEPARGMSDDPMKLYHDPHIYPHHQYIAAYLWLKNGFQADAMIHLGTHATYEWLPGKQAALSHDCPPEIMITDIPNIYPYIMDDVGEGIQAKRRGRGVIIDHLTPALVPAEGYHEYAELNDLIASYEQAQSVGASVADAYRQQIRSLAQKLGLDKDLDLNTFDEEDIRDMATYLEQVATGYIPYGLHSFGISPEGEALEGSVDAVMAQNKALDRNAVTTDFSISGSREIQALLKALKGGYIPPKEGNDPVRNPQALPSGGNFYGLSPDRIPSQAAWLLGQKAASDMIETYRKEHQTYPEKVAVVLWAVETLRNEGVNEATILSLIGMEPVWNQGGKVTGVRPVPAMRLNRPRIDVTINASGLYRDLFPDKILFLDDAIRQAAIQDDLENFIRRNDQRIKDALIQSGMGAKEAENLAKIRIFSEAPGAYGNRVEELTSASGLWKDDSAISDVYRKHSSFAYGRNIWGSQAQQALDENLKDARIAWHSVSSNVYGVMDNDDMYMYLGGMSMAIRKLSGKAPMTVIANQRQAGEVSIEGLQKFIAQEMRSRYLNPKWIEAMRAENYAGTRELSNYVEYLWGWQVTTPEAVDKSTWEQTYEVYIEDKYNLDMKDVFKDNPWAYQSITARMLEAVRKDYWQAPDSVKQTLARDYVLNVLANGLACCDHTCNNPHFHQMVMNIISLPGVMSPELAAEFKLAVEKAMQKSLEEQVAQREQLLENLGQNPKQPEQASSAEKPELENVKGLKMEPLEKKMKRQKCHLPVWNGWQLSLFLPF